MDMHTLLHTAMYCKCFYFRCFSTQIDIVLACQAVVTHCRLINSLLNSNELFTQSLTQADTKQLIALS